MGAGCERFFLSSHQRRWFLHCNGVGTRAVLSWMMGHAGWWGGGSVFPELGKGSGNCGFPAGAGIVSCWSLMTGKCTKLMRGICWCWKCWVEESSSIRSISRLGRWSVVEGVERTFPNFSQLPLLRGKEKQAEPSLLHVEVLCFGVAGAQKEGCYTTTGCGVCLRQSSALAIAVWSKSPGEKRFPSMRDTRTLWVLTEEAALVCNWRQIGFAVTIDLILTKGRLPLPITREISLMQGSR